MAHPAGRDRQGRLERNDRTRPPNPRPIRGVSALYRACEKALALDSMDGSVAFGADRRRHGCVTMASTSVLAAITRRHNKVLAHVLPFRSNPHAAPKRAGRTDLP